MGWGGAGSRTILGSAVCVPRCPRKLNPSHASSRPQEVLALGCKPCWAVGVGPPQHVQLVPNVFTRSVPSWHRGWQRDTPKVPVPRAGMNPEELCPMEGPSFDLLSPSPHPPRDAETPPQGRPTFTQPLTSSSALKGTCQEGRGPEKGGGVP